MRGKLTTFVAVLFITVLLASALGFTGAASVYAQQNTARDTLISQADSTPQTDPDQTQSDEPQDPTDQNTTGTGDDQLDPTVEPAETCESSVTSLGWVICPIIEIAFGLFTWLTETVLQDGLLRIDIIDDEPALKNVWSNFKTIANIVFVIAFLVIIYAEAAGRFALLETYSITRMIPRVIFAVIGIQLSFFISGYLVQVFNILGDGITDLILAPVEGSSQFYFGFGFSEDGGGNLFGIPVGDAGDFVLGGVVGLAFLAGLIWVAYIVLFTLLWFAVVALLIMFFVLILRKVLIVALVIASPIAFAAFVLPGTERLYKMWWDSFSKALAMYPLIMLFIASGQLVGRIAITGDPTFLDSVVGMIATFAPFFLIPATFRLAGSVVATVAGGIGNIGEKVKGDVRDPNSMRSRERQKRLQRYGRLMGGDVRTPANVGKMGGRFKGIPLGALGNKSIMPGRIARAYNRLPGTDSSASLMADIQQGREGAEMLAKTLGDESLKAMAVTGGGMMRGVRVNTGDGQSVWSGYAKLGNHFAYNDQGQIITRNGVAQMYDSRGRQTNAMSSNFYSADTMSQVRKYAGNRGAFAASLEHAMSKTDNNNYMDQEQIKHGIDGSKWTKTEKIGMSQGVWNKVKDQGIHHKFTDWDDFYHEGGVFDRHKNVRGDEKAKIKFDKMLGFIDSEMQAYPISQQKAPAWNALNQGLADFKHKKIKSEGDRTGFEVDQATGGRQADMLESLAYKALGIIDQDRKMRASGVQLGEDGEPQSIASGSNATGSAAREARTFLNRYKRIFGRLPGDANVERLEEFETDPRFL